MIVLDFETRSPVDLRACGASVYARHPQTQVLCLAWAGEAGPVRLWTPRDSVEVLAPVFRHLAAGGTLCGHNVLFERQIWSHVCAARMGWPAVPESAWRCSGFLCSLAGLPRSLAKAATAAGLPAEKDDAGRRVMLELCRPDKHGAFRESAAKSEVLYEYCRRDVEVQRALALKIQAVSTEAERELWQLDQRINLRGIPIDLESVRASLNVVEQVQSAGRARLSELTDGKVRSVSERQRILDWLGGRGVTLPDLRAATVRETLDGGVDEPAAREVLTLRRDLGKGSVAKLAAMDRRCDADGRVRGALVFHGAATGRWAGAGMQIQNFPRGGLRPPLSERALSLVRQDARRPHGGAEGLRMFWGRPLHAMAATLRSLICAPPGRVLLVGDFAQIEARALAWLADHRDQLQIFADRGDPYAQMGAAIHRVDAEKCTPAQRQIGKMAVLGCGYGMGAAQFRRSCAAAGVEVEEAFAQQAVIAYRQHQRPIVRFWRDLEDAAMRAVERGPGAKPLQVGRVRMRVENWSGCDCLFVRLPSGRKIVYRDPRVVPCDAPWASDGVQKVLQLHYRGVHLGKYAELSTYGGKLAENVTQAVARDFLAASMIRLDASHFELVATVHDEIIAEHDNAEAIDAFRDLMSQSPAWGEGCPLAVDAFAARRYRK